MALHKRIAQVLAAIAAAAMFLTWHTTTDESLNGVATDEGQLALVVSLVTVGLIQVGWRPAWIGAGFTTAITVRALLDGDSDPGLGLWLATAASLVAAGLLIWAMFTDVADGDTPDKPDGRGLSGPLGRRRR